MKGYKMELTDIYDKDGNIIAVGRPREAALREGEYRIAVGMWIVNDKGEIFLTKRSPEKKFAPNKWENPAGHVQSGENCVTAILREVQEETGLTVTEQQIELLGDSKKMPSYLGKNYGVRMNFDLSVIKLQPGETCDAKWVDYAEFKRMVQTEELAPSVVDHMEGYRENFLKFIGQTEL